MRRRLVPSRSAARRAIVEGHVAVEGVTAPRPATPVTPDDVVLLDPAAVRYVGRGGQKLAAALESFGIVVTDRRGLDIGSSTGGFTDCLLQNGAAHVVAVDVGTDQLDPALRSDRRVTVREQTDIRMLDPHEAGAPFDVVVADVSFLSLRSIAGVVAAFGDPRTDWVMLVKPQFEAGPAARSRRGVVDDPQVRRTAVDETIAAFGEHGLVEQGRMESPVVGAAGNVEHLVWLRRGAES